MNQTIGIKSVMLMVSVYTRTPTYLTHSAKL